MNIKVITILAAMVLATLPAWSKTPQAESDKISAGTQAQAEAYCRIYLDPSNRLQCEQDTLKSLSSAVSFKLHIVGRILKIEYKGCTLQQARARVAEEDVWAENCNLTGKNCKWPPIKCSGNAKH